MQGNKHASKHVKHQWKQAIKKSKKRIQNAYKRQKCKGLSRQATSGVHNKWCISCLTGGNCHEYCLHDIKMLFSASDVYKTKNVYKTFTKIYKNVRLKQK